MNPSTIKYRPMRAEDIGRVPGDCFGGADVLAQRIEDVGSAAILAFDRNQHVAQLQFRRYDATLRSSEGIWHPDYWGDFGDHAPSLSGPTLNVFCYHVGQLVDGDDRDPRYHGRGIGLALLDSFLAWARGIGFVSVVAKFTPDDRAVMGFMGGQPARAYQERGFEVLNSWIDQQLAETLVERGLVDAQADPDIVARVGVCMARLG